MYKPLIKLSLIYALCAPFAYAELLPNPGNVTIEGDSLTWEAVEGATGYNIYFDGRYYDTVRDRLQYRVSEPGSYWPTAFDDAGNFGNQYGFDDTGDIRPEYIAEDGVDSNVSLVVNSYTVIAQKTCTNVGPGESCVATCPRSFQSPFGNASRFSRYLSGGACSTSDIVEADAFASNFTYSCTVPTFSGEVVAQAICVHGNF